MTRRGFASATAAATVFAQISTAAVRLKVSTARMAQRPISKLLFGQFIESGFGFQTNGLWAEMIYNRSFQKPMPPFSNNTWGWLMLKPESYNSNAPFWHSGYEQYDWEPIDANHTMTSRTNGADTFKGLGSLAVSHDGEAEKGGLRQKGLYLKKEQVYDFSIQGRYQGDRYSKETFDLTIALLSESEPQRVIFERVVKLEPNQRQFDFDISPNGYTGRATLEISFRSKGSIRLAFCSMMPRNNVRGWNGDVVALLKKVSPPIIRYPGGCYASFYDWRATVGPRSERAPVPSFYWGELEENDAGLDEFLDLCFELQCEPQICVNMMTATAFKAGELVQYCNGPDDSPMGQFRVLNGVRRRNRVNYWEMDNEAGRKWPASEYARQIVGFAAQMRKADPNIKIMMEYYSFGPNRLGEMLEIAGSQADLVITRSTDRESIAKGLAIIREYNARSGRNVVLCNTEWLALRGDAPEPFDDPEIPQILRMSYIPGNDYKKTLNFRQIHWYYALNVGNILTGLLCHGGELNHTNFNNCVNTWGQNIIESAREGAWLSAAGRVFEFMKITDLEYPLTTEVQKADNAFLTCQACSTSGGGMTIFLVNQGTKRVDATVELPAGLTLSSVETLFAPDRLSRATLGKDEIQVEKRNVTGSTLSLRPLSITKAYVQA